MIVMSGNVLETPIEIIAHQVNCMGSFGSGLAKQIKEKHPYVYKRYRAVVVLFRCKGMDRRLLGQGQMVCDEDSGHTFLNIFGQYRWSCSTRQTDYDALKAGFNNAIMKYRLAKNAYDKLQIAVPYKIGCGCGGGDWNIVSEILEQLESEENVEFVAYKL